ncbi:hypothetical protein Ciccas_013972 [Cichlidogyrus casuarinus]|uniref:Serine/arginine-rich splicing factor 2 n=1 Tax=Cichlidogyrus casuarinus TaxID=1844966 RepID=A0ABD2PM74_9PLAT
MSRFHYGRGPPPSSESLVSLKIDNLAYRTDVDTLKHYFTRYGEVGDIYIPRDPKTRGSRGFAFVRYYKDRDADYAIKKLDGKEIDGRRITVQMAKYGRPSRPREDEVIVGADRDHVRGAGRVRRRGVRKSIRVPDQVRVPGQIPARTREDPSRGRILQTRANHIGLKRNREAGLEVRVTSRGSIRGGDLSALLTRGREARASLDRVPGNSRTLTRTTIEDNVNKVITFILLTKFLVPSFSSCFRNNLSSNIIVGTEVS